MQPQSNLNNREDEMEYYDQRRQFSPRWSLFAKDISDWVKIVGLGALIVMGYQALKDQVAQHTTQLQQVQGDLTQLKKDEGTHYENLNKSMGRMNMYLCSKDAAYCKEAIPPPQ